MSDDFLEDLDLEESPSVKLCPLLQAKCVQSRCAWWVRDWHEEKNRYTVECAVSLIAVGVNDESLFRLKGKRPSESV